MIKGIIRLVYRKLIDNTASSGWEKYVFEDTHKEFYMQAQQFDRQGTYTTFKEMADNIPKAEQMHYLVSTAAINYIRQLEEKMPDVTNAFGKHCVPFKNFSFEIIRSHIQDKKQHQVAIHFYSESLIWIGSIDKHLLLTLNNQAEALQNGQEVNTEMIVMIPNLSISSFKKA